MSVVNKMLRDLEARENGQQVSANYIHSTNKHWLYLIFAFVLLVMTIVSTFYVLKVFELTNDEESQPSLGPQQDTFNRQKGDEIAQLVKPPVDAEYVTRLKTIDQTPTTKVQVEESRQPNAEDTRLVETELAETKLLETKLTETMLAKTELEKTKGQPAAQKNIQAKSSPYFSVSPSNGANQRLSLLRAQAHIAAQQQDDARVIDLLSQILALSPNENRTRKQLSALLYSKKRLNEAQGVLLEGLKLSPEDTDLRLMLSRILFKSGDHAKAFKLLNQHPRANSASDEFISFRAALAEKIGNYKSAQNDYYILLKRNPNDAKWWLGLGVSQDKQKLAEQAINSYQQAKSLKQLPKAVESFVVERIQLLARQS